MKRTSMLVLVASPVLLATLAGHGRENDRAKTEQYIIESEHQWAEADVHGDVASVQRILADDFVGVAPNGTLYDKAQEIADTQNDHGNTVSNHVHQVKVRFFGDTAVAQGSETWEKRSGESRRGTYVWTDTWVQRNGNWQIVAAEDLLAPAKGNK